MSTASSSNSSQPALLPSSPGSSVAVSTTTIYTGSTAYPTAVSSSGSTVPIGAIAGGAASGVFLAVAAVVGWKLWGRCIKRRAMKQRKEALAILEVRENTRRNAASGVYGASRPASSGTTHDRKVSFVASSPSLAQSTFKSEKGPGIQTRRASVDAVTGRRTQVVPRAQPAPNKPETASEKRRSSNDTLVAPPASVPSTPAKLPPPRRPRQTLLRPSPLGRNVHTGEGKVLTRNENNTRRQSSAPNPPPVQPFLTRRLFSRNRVSVMSAESAYSEQSGEEHENRVSTSLIVAALEHLDPRRSWLGNYLPVPISRQPTSGDETEHSRLSMVSTSSFPDDLVDEQPDVPIGYAYSGEDGATPERVV